MRCVLAPFVGLLTAASASVAEAQEDFETNIMGGPGTGTYIQLARDIGGVVDNCGKDVNVIESEGGMENFMAVRARPFTHVGLTRNDVLEYLTTFAQEDPVVADAVAGMRIVMPMHVEPVQLIAGRDVESLSDLDGLRVGVGPEGSASFLTSSLILDLSGVEPAERVAQRPGDLRDALLAGDLDAFMYVAGLPTSVFSSPELDTGEWHMVPIDDPTLEAVYQPSTIPAATYPFEDDAVRTVAARSVLVTYEYDPSRSAYHRRSCEAVSDIAHLVSTSLEELRETGHPAWQTVDLDAVPAGWEVSACAAEGLEPDYDPGCEGPPEGAETVPQEGAATVYRGLICDELGTC